MDSITGQFSEIRTERKKALAKHLTISSIFAKEVLERVEASVFTSKGIKFSVTYCDGDRLMLVWEKMTLDDVEYPMHIHAHSHEWIGVDEGSMDVVFEDGLCHTFRVNGEASQRRAAYICPEQAHKLVFRGPAKGWMLLIPPETNYLPIDEADGLCGLASTSVCTCKRLKCLIAVARAEVTGGPNDRSGRSVC